MKINYIFFASILFLTNCVNKINPKAPSLNEKTYAKCFKYINYLTAENLLPSYCVDSLITKNFLSSPVDNSIHILKIRAHYLLVTLNWYEIRNNKIFVLDKNKIIIDSTELSFEPNIQLHQHTLYMLLCNNMTSDLGMESYFIRTKEFTFQLRIDNASLLDCDIDNIEFPEIFKLLYILPQ